MEVVRQTTGHAEANGTRFYYEMAGSGDPLVLVHAGPADRRMWDSQFQAFAQQYRVIRYDMRGYGNTPKAAGGYSTSQDLEALLRAIGIERATLIGSSQGGTDALDFALEHPTMVNALILVSTTPSGYEFQGPPPQKLMEFFSAYQQQELQRASELAAQIWFDGPKRGPQQVSSDMRGWVQGMMRDVLAAQSLDPAGLESSGRPAVDRLGEIRVPSLVIVGDQDDPSILQAGEQLASGIPGAQMVVIPGAAHLANVERPEEFNQAVLGFLSRLR